MSVASLTGKNLLLVISGGIAAYKTLELIRRLREQGARVRCILTKGGAQFVTPLAVSSLSGEKFYQDLWSLTDEQEMGHIRLVREADLIIVAPASANLLAKLAHGLADDLASTALLAATVPILLAPAMNGTMWANAATQANLALLRQRGYYTIGPASGDLACGEVGTGRLADVPDIFAEIGRMLGSSQALTGIHSIVTSGPTQEPVDAVRFLGNRSSGKQGQAIAESLARHGARVTLISGPVSLPAPIGVTVLRVTTAQEMLDATLAALPADVFVGCAAVADWRVNNAAVGKLKRDAGQPKLELAENPDILATLSRHALRPRLVIGFAAEAGNLMEQASAKLARKGCDWLVANDVSHGQVFASDMNEVLLLKRQADSTVTQAAWPRQNKRDLAEQLTQTIIQHLQKVPS